jgi:hypothetical protein
MPPLDPEDDEPLEIPLEELDLALELVALPAELNEPVRLEVLGAAALLFGAAAEDSPALLAGAAAAGLLAGAAAGAELPFR